MEIYLVGVEFPIGTDIEETAGGVIGTGTEGVSVGEELNGVDIGFVTSKGLDSLAGTDIPKFSEGIAAPETKTFWLVGLMLMDMTSPRWSANSVTLEPVSISHSIQVMSPDEVRMRRSLMKRQQDR